MQTSCAFIAWLSELLLDEQGYGLQGQLCWGGSAVSEFRCAVGNLDFNVDPRLPLLSSLIRLFKSAQQNDETFSGLAFWSGFWFRMGESVLFVLMLFLIIFAEVVSTQDKVKLKMLPTFALLVGMFVKSGERVLFGLAERMFGMINGLLPAQEAQEGATQCNTAAGDATNTGSRSACISNYGAFDMVGNVAEWVVD